MIVSPFYFLKRLIVRWQSALEINASLSRPAIFGIRLYEVILMSPSNPSKPIGTLINSVDLVATALCRRARKIHNPRTPRHSEATTSL